MIVRKQPFFFTDEDFISDFHAWKELLDKAFDSSGKVPKFQNQSITNEDIQKLTLYCIDILKANEVFLTMVNRIFTQINK